MDRVLHVTTGNRTNNHKQAVVECTHIHKADDDEDQDEVGEAVSEYQLHVSIVGRAYVKDATDENDPAPDVQAAEVVVNSTLKGTKQGVLGALRLKSLRHGNELRSDVVIRVVNGSGLDNDGLGLVHSGLGAVLHGLHRNGLGLRHSGLRHCRLRLRHCRLRLGHCRLGRNVYQMRRATLSAPFTVTAGAAGMAYVCWGGRPTK